MRLETARRVRTEFAMGGFKGLWHFRRGIVTAAWQDLAWLLPRRLVYFASIRLVAHATTGEYGNTVVPELTALDAIGRWGDE